MAGLSQSPLDTSTCAMPDKTVTKIEGKSLRETYALNEGKILYHKDTFVRGLLLNDGILQLTRSPALKY